MGKEASYSHGPPLTYSLSLHICICDLKILVTPLSNNNSGEEMASIASVVLPVLLILLTLGAKPSQSKRVFTIINGCKETIWPAVFPGENFNGGGFVLKAGQSAVFTAPVSWSGRIWGRTGCNFDQSGSGKCQTGNCGSNLKCTGSGDPPASLAEFTLGNLDFYDVSLVDGFNLPIAITPVITTKGNCSAAGCDKDLRASCPSELSVKRSGKTVACRSACDVFNTDQYCCRGLYGNAMTCRATTYSKTFKDACPRAYSYAYDDPTSIFTCPGADYTVSFCGSRNQTVCTYHHNKVVCNGSISSKSLSRNWMVLMSFYALMMTLWIVS